MRAWMVTSSAVVGSSAMTSRGRLAKAAWQVHGLQQIKRACPSFPRRTKPESAQVFIELLADGEHRVERGERFLRNERDLATEQSPPIVRRHRDQIATAEQEAPGRNREPGGKHLRDGAADHRFAGPGFADKPDHAALLERQAEVAQHRHQVTAELR
jgi:hypothetical protein